MKKRPEYSVAPPRPLPTGGPVIPEAAFAPEERMLLNIASDVVLREGTPAMRARSSGLRALNDAIKAARRNGGAS